MGIINDIAMESQRIETNINNALIEVKNRGVDVTDKTSDDLPSLVDSIYTESIDPSKIELACYNGTKWTECNISGINARARDAKYNNDIIVASGISGMYYSMDGKEWHQSNLIEGVVVYFEYFNDSNMWLATSRNGTESYSVYYSLDGKEWIQSNLTGKRIDVVKYSGGIFVAGSSNITDVGIYYSLDGKEWHQSNITEGVANIEYANNIWRVICSTHNNYYIGCDLYYSLDGKEWIANGPAVGTFQNMKYANGVWVVIGSDLCYSLDGKEWHESNVDVPENTLLDKIFHVNDIWITIGHNVLYYSLNGKEWYPSNVTVTNTAIVNVEYADGVWILDMYGIGIYYSLDGKTWIQSNTPSQMGRTPSKKFYHYNSIWIAWDEHGLYYSTDGKEWYQSNLTNGNFNSVLYNSGVYVAANWDPNYGNGYLCYSFDGKEWYQSTDITEDWLDVLYYKNIWVAVGDKFYYSVTWEDK